MMRNKKAMLICNLFRKFISLKNKSHLSIIKLNLKDKQLPSTNNNSNTDLNLRPDNEYTYIGSLFKNMKDGFALQIYPKQQCKYSGLFKNNNPIGICQFINNTNNSEYKGYQQHMEANNYGILIQNNPDKYIYEGYFIANKKNGYGIEIYSDDSRYEGMFKNDEKCGLGTYYWSDGSYIQGEWKKNELNGYGIYMFKDGKYYKGKWKEHQMEGFGEFTYPNNKSYIGYFKQDQKDGFGILYWYNEKKMYVGFWKENKQSGFGKYVVNDNEKMNKWDNGIQTKVYKNKNEFLMEVENENGKGIAELMKQSYEDIGYIITSIVHDS